MAEDRLRIKRGTTAEVLSYDALDGEPVWDTQANQLYLDDVRVGSPVSALGAQSMNAPDQASARAVIGALGPADSTTGNAATATKLQTARTIQTNLASTSSASFDGTANVTPGVTGTLPVTNGGTGTTASTGTGSVVLSASPALTGTPTAPTAAIGTNTTQVATMAAIQARLVGTVSQSGGVPTGTIFETGGNLLNGKWTKYANGDLVFHRRLSITTTISSAVGSIFYSGVIAATPFGVSFVGDVPTVQLTLEDGLGTTWCSASSPPTLVNAPAFYLFAPTSTVSRTYIVNITANGKWF